MAGSKTGLFLLGAGALAFLATRKKSSSPVIEEAEEVEPDPEDAGRRYGSTARALDWDEDDGLEGLIAILDECEHPEKLASLGRMYQVRRGDTPFDVAQEALFGTRGPVEDEGARRAIIELSIRIDCAPWNQTSYASSPPELEQGHAAVEENWSPYGVSFRPLYENNRARMLGGEAPTARRGHHRAYIWIPMINLDRFDDEGIITIEGMNYEDSEAGRGHSMIDPPREILELGFETIAANNVGSAFPEGDFRRSLEKNE